MSTQIYTGLWTDWDRGRVYGATITLSARSGAVLLAFLAFFVTIAALRLWRLLTYAIHQLLHSPGAHDGLYYQRQYILRNVTSPSTAAWLFAQQAWYWRRVADHAVMRSVPSALFSLAYLLLFAAVSILSSQVSDGASENRLLKAQDCGFRMANNDTFPRADENREAATYARQCYDTDADLSACGGLPVPSLPWKNSSTQCPFAAPICLDVPAFRMRTDLLDSHSHFGINAQREDRIEFRRETVCSPLVTQPGYAVYVRGAESQKYGWDDDVLIKYMYGPQGPGIDYTHIYLNYSVNANMAYNVWASTYSEQGLGAWEPIDDLRLDSRDITIMFIAPNSILHLEPTTDPVFSATIEQILSDGTKIYRPDRFVSPIACTDQYQICNPSNKACTPMDGSLSLSDNAMAQDIALNVAQLGTARRVSFVVSQQSFYDLIFTRTQSFLRAQDRVAGLTQQPLPSNQWQIEMSTLFSDSLALLQQSIVDYPTGRSIHGNTTILKPWDNKGSSEDELGKSLLAMCKSQRVKSTQGTLNFSVLGLGILIGVGTLVILLSYLINPLADLLYRRTPGSTSASRSWIRDDFLQVRRMLFDAVGAGEWAGPVGSFPRTVRPQWFEYDEKN